jgi:hypothetical protein
MSRTNEVRNPRGMIRRDHSAQARLLRVKAQGIDLGRSPLSTPGPLTGQFIKLKGRVPQGRAHAQSPGNLVRLLGLDKSHDAIQTRIHDEMSQRLCLTPTRFGNHEVLSHKVTPLALQHMQQHPSRSVMHTTLCCIKTPYTQQHSTASY